MAAEMRKFMDAVNELFRKDVFHVSSLGNGFKAEGLVISTSKGSKDHYYVPALIKVPEDIDEICKDMNENELIEYLLEIGLIRKSK